MRDKEVVIPRIRGKARLVVLVSGSGTNLQAIINAVDKGSLRAEIKAVVADRKCYAVERALKRGIPAYIVERGALSRESHEREILKIIRLADPHLIVLAGYMLLLSKSFVKKFRYKIINIHPALLPAFPGTHGYEDAWEYGVKVSGCTVHFVDEEMDHGPIIIQKPLLVREDDTLESFKKRGLRNEHIAFPKAIKMFIEGRLVIKGRRVAITGKAGR